MPTNSVMNNIARFFRILVVNKRKRQKNFFLNFFGELMFVVSFLIFRAITIPVIRSLVSCSTSLHDHVKQSC